MLAKAITTLAKTLAFELKIKCLPTAVLQHFISLGVYFAKTHDQCLTVEESGLTIMTAMFSYSETLVKVC